MVQPKRSSSGQKPKRLPPAKTPEGRENQMIALAMDQAELMMLEGTAPAPIITHFLKAGSQRDKLERERLQNENALLIRKVENLESTTRSEELNREVIQALREYQGGGRDHDYE